MTDEQFKQIVHEIQGKYFKKEYINGNIHLRKVVKVKINEYNTNPESVWFDVYYNLIKLESQPIEEQRSFYYPCMGIKTFYKHFGERIKPFEYNSKLRNRYEHEYQRRD